MLSEMDRIGSMSPTDSTIKKALQATRDGDLRFGRVHAELLSFHHDLGGGMDHYNEAIRLLRKAGHDKLANQLLAPVARGVLTNRWSWSVVEEYEERFFEKPADLKGKIEAKNDKMAVGGCNEVTANSAPTKSDAGD